MSKLVRLEIEEDELSAYGMALLIVVLLLCGVCYNYGKYVAIDEQLKSEHINTPQHRSVDDGVHQD